MLQWWRRLLQRILGPFRARRWRIPRVQAAQVTFNPVDVRKNEHDQCWLQLGANVHGGQGMVLTVALQGRPNGAGSLEFVQLMKPRRLRHRVSTGNNETSSCRSSTLICSTFGMGQLPGRRCGTFWRTRSSRGSRSGRSS